jgi:hypothetical protein
VPTIRVSLASEHESVIVKINNESVTLNPADSGCVFIDVPETPPEPTTDQDPETPPGPVTE